VKTPAQIALAMVTITLSEAQGATLFDDDSEAYPTVAAGLSAGLWSRYEGAVAVSTHYAHSGATSYQLAYGSVEAQSFLGISVPGEHRHLFLRWWELRERAGDFAGAGDYDWSAEKTMRLRSAVIGSTGVDYPIGWSADTGLGGTSGTDGPGAMGIFGNSTASNGDDLISTVVEIERGVWNMFEVEIDLGDVGQANGAVRLWVNDVLVAQRSGVVLLPQNAASIDEIWVGGWYSGGRNPNPAPARRYVDDVVVAEEKIGFGVGANAPPGPPTNLVAH
jgi:hypothetical protein